MSKIITHVTFGGFCVDCGETEAWLVETGKVIRSADLAPSELKRALGSLLIDGLASRAAGYVLSARRGNTSITWFTSNPTTTDRVHDAITQHLTTCYAGSGVLKVR